VGLATAAHQGWSANLFRSPPIWFPKAAVGKCDRGLAACRVQSVGHTAIGDGLHCENYEQLRALFVVACAAYMLALVIIHGITPKLAPAQLES